ncbi:MAG: 1-deoxy-D-xylulose-5-phosphate reductoisomerase, partial [Bryobacterales bacterium]|nr:1-deoxy-D-xylulose-5-phosphate reductoisomerase [Bryobacterales bacterium]
IGTSTLDVVRRNREQYEIYSLVAGTNVDLLVEQIREFEPKVVVVADSRIQDRLAARLHETGLRPELAHGARARVAVSIAPEVDYLMSAIVGVAGLEATYEAIVHGKSVGLANKETLVAGGELVMAAVKKHGTQMIPVDSEHNGAHQCLRAGRREDVAKLILTASGGPFRKTPKERMQLVTVA